MLHFLTRSYVSCCYFGFVDVFCTYRPPQRRKVGVLFPSSIQRNPHPDILAALLWAVCTQSIRRSVWAAAGVLCRNLMAAQCGRSQLRPAMRMDVPRQVCPPSPLLPISPSTQLREIIPDRGLDVWVLFWP